jgi:uncharacterized membrane protein
VDAAVIAFHHIEGADHEYASALERVSGAQWLRKIALVEVHHRGRIVVRGTIAGHYVDIDDEDDLIGRDTGVGAIIGAVVGLAGGPPGLAVGLVVGGTVGGLREAHHIPTLRGPAFDEIRKDVPENSSAIVLVADPGEVDAMISAFAGTGGRLTRYRLSPEAYAELEAAVASSPPAAPQPFPPSPWSRTTTASQPRTAGPEPGRSGDPA